HPEYDVLCLMANDAAGLERAVAEALRLAPAAPGPLPPVPPPVAPAVAWSAPVTVSSQATSQITPAITWMTNNEMINSMVFDPAGNLYIGTWGHGKNLYSLDAKGQHRFARHL